MSRKTAGPIANWDRAYLWRFRAQPLRVIDGDTLVALCDTGFWGRHEVHIRLDGVFAPELSAPDGPRARIALVDLLFASLVSDWPLRIETVQRETVVEETRSFERFVARVWIVEDDVLVSVNAALA